MRPPIDPIALSDLIGRIYDCALDPSLWQSTLDAMRQELGFEHATLSLQAMPSGQVLINETSGIASPWLERIPHYGQDIVALWGGAAAINNQPLEEPVLLSEVHPQILDGSSLNRYYLEWRKPQQLTDTLAIGLSRDDQSLAAASWVRHASQGPIGEPERQAARLFAPHLRRAVTISRLLDAQSVMAANFRKVLDGLQTPIMLAGPDLSLVHANDAAQAALAQGFPLSVRGGRLVSESELVGRALAAAVDQALSDERLMARKGLGIPARNGASDICVLHVLPLTSGARRTSLTPGAAVAIFLASTRSSRTDVGEFMAALFDLTPAERAVFDLVAQGLGLPEAAKALAVRPSTAKTHLLRVFEKTGLRRQSELARLAGLLSSA